MEWKFLNDPISRIVHFGEYLFIINQSAENAICAAEGDLVIYEQHYISCIHLIRKKNLWGTQKTMQAFRNLKKHFFSRLARFLLNHLFMHLSFPCPHLFGLASCPYFSIFVKLKSFFVPPGKFMLAFPLYFPCISSSFFLVSCSPVSLCHLCLHV